jgi:hypothetical protein
MAPPFVSLQMKLQKYFLSSHNPIDFTPITFNNVASFSNDVRLCGISSVSGNQQHIEIIVLVINLIYSPSTESTPSGFLKFGIDGLVLFPPLSVSLLEVKKKHSYDVTWKFQVEWAIKLPWVEMQVGFDGCGKYVKCKKSVLKLIINISSLHVNGILSRNMLVIER